MPNYVGQAKAARESKGNAGSIFFIILCLVLGIGLAEPTRGRSMLMSVAGITATSIGMAMKEDDKKA